MLLPASVLENGFTLEERQNLCINTYVTTYVTTYAPTYASA